jgi:putative tryptophan/tyrosine transport system substrate-binding protein
LRQLGWVDGRNIHLEWRFDEHQVSRLPQLVAELLTQNVKLIVAGHTGAALAARRATSTVPIVMAVSGDPVADGLVASLARPGGNVTGLSIMTPELTAKRLQLLTEAVPGISRVAVLVDKRNTRSPLELRANEEAAQALGLKITPVSFDSPDEFGAAFETARRSQAQAMVALQSITVAMNHSQLAALALTHRMPVVAGSSDRQFARVGGLMNFGASITSSWQAAASYVHKILQGAKPADLPVQQPTRFELSINGKTAAALGLTLPPHLLLLADEVFR